MENDKIKLWIVWVRLLGEVVKKYMISLKPEYKVCKNE